MKRLKVLAVIPARGGSKGIARKNTVLLGGKPLLHWTLDAARRSRHLSDILLSTDSPRIRRLGLRWGCPAPFLRPKALATDRASSLGAIQHAVRWYENHTGRPLDAVLVLQPTSPFRDSRDIDRSIDLLQRNHSADSVVSFLTVTHAHPHYLYRFKSTWAEPLSQSQRRDMPRQRIEPVYVRNGAIYLVRRSILMQRGSMMGTRILPYLMPPERSVNIDDFFDLRIAKGLLRVRR